MTRRECAMARPSIAATAAAAHPATASETSVTPPIGA